MSRKTKKIKSRTLFCIKLRIYVNVTELLKASNNILKFFFLIFRSVFRTFSNFCGEDFTLFWRHHTFRKKTSIVIFQEIPRYSSEFNTNYIHIFIQSQRTINSKWPEINKDKNIKDSMVIGLVKTLFLVAAEPAELLTPV